MEYRILGPLEVLDGGQTLAVRGGKLRALLADLLIHANQVVSTERLIDDLWGESPPDTATSALQVYVSQLRKLLESERGTKGSVLARKAPGYVLNMGPDELDRSRFERRAAEGNRDLEDSRFDAASRRLSEALSEWRGEALAEFAYEAFARSEIERLNTLRLSVLEDRISADLARGRHHEVSGELETLVRQHPLREGLRARLMLALYRSGRQADALQVFQDGRRMLADELGIDPGHELKRLESSILAQDPSLDLRIPVQSRSTARSAPSRSSALVAALDQEGLEALIPLARVLGRSDPPRELILARLLTTSEADQEGGLPLITADLERHRAGMTSEGVASRVIAFTTPDPGEDVVRLSVDYRVDLVLAGARGAVTGETSLDPWVRRLLEELPCAVALAAWPLGTDPAPLEGTVVVPFGGGEHDWAALEFGARVAQTMGMELRLLGTAAPNSDHRDSSRLLANASLVIQEVTGVVAEPTLVVPGPEAVLEAAGDAGLLVMGISERWKDEGIGAVRSEIARGANALTVMLRRGGATLAHAAPREMTQFPWSGHQRTT
jgi:DNA-binding SARP family transcriptional activator